MLLCHGVAVHGKPSSCLYVYTLLCMTAVQELSTNHRQSGDTSWSDCTNVLRKWTDANAVHGVYETLKTRMTKLPAATAGSCTDLCNKELRTYGLWPWSDWTLRTGPAGACTSCQMPKDMDNCGGLADVVEV